MPTRGGEPDTRRNVAGSASTSRSSPLSDQWACPTAAYSGFATDPLVHQLRVSLREIASEVPGADSFEIDRRGQRATVTYRDAEGLIVHIFEYSQGVERGWALDRGRTCGW